MEVKRRLREIIGRKKVYSPRSIERLYKEFKEKKRRNTRDKRCGRAGRPRSATDEDHQNAIEHLMSIQRNWTIGELAQELEISHGSVVNLLKKMGFKKRGSSWIPHQLTATQKIARVNTAEQNLQSFESDARILRRIIAFDETVWRCYTPPDPNQCAEWRRSGEAGPTRVAQFREPWSRHLIMAINQDQIISYEWLNPGERWNQDTIIRFLNGSLREYVERNMTGVTPIILMDGARWHTGARTMSLIQDELHWEILPHPSFRFFIQ